ncbi:unnamed protein product [Rhizoctonia solani]|uniref:Zn-dependent exopeptidase n=1 Tax=Rhizoctonia solani TaxID=456999 RepID=A0A8H2WZX4_9AGAM|nr:unnamed protein product [Rhizoctonia solani]CAE6491970.1 unnamed protein product [Rhizoctonia solani]
MPQGDSANSEGNPAGLDHTQVEEIFLSIPSPQSAQAVSAEWTSEPHLAGSKNDYKSAVELLHAFQDHLDIPRPEPLPIYDAGTPESRNTILGISKLETPRAWIDTYYPLLETPGERKLEILDANGAVSWSANLEEGDAIGAWHAWSKSADVKGKVIYANHGYDSDFEKLKKAGYDIAGKIALFRESGTFRGLRIKTAAQAGAIGCLIFTDPSKDPATIEHGYKTWPEGPARHPRAVTRGHVMDISMKSGDPTTPGYPSYRDSPRVEPDSFPSIPSLPISWSNAEVLLKDMEKSGGKISERDVRLVNQVRRKIGPIWNVMVAIPGHIRDEVVIAGNHRDAWVFGASDPTSGTVSLHEMSKGLGELLRRGWKPLRTILLASWDGKEVRTRYIVNSNLKVTCHPVRLIREYRMGGRFSRLVRLILNAVTWIDFATDWLKKHAVAYINVDKSASGGELLVRGTPSIAPLLRQVALDIPHYDETKPDRTLWDARTDRGPFKGAPKETWSDDRPPVYSTGIRTLGSGSDYTIFLQQLGITCGDLAFTTGEGDAAYPYHSFYDSEDWMDRYGDPGCLRRVAIAKYWGLVLLRIADSFILPLDTTQYALELDDYLDKIDTLFSTFPDAPDITQLRDAIKKLQGASRNLDLHKAQAHTRLHDYINRTKDSSTQDSRISVQQALGSFSDGQPATFELKELFENIRLINNKLFNFEGGFISEAGLPGREWYRHMIVAPGKWIGYGATTFPSLAEAVTVYHDPDVASQQVERLTQLLHKLADFLNEKVDQTKHPDQPQLSAL